MTITIIEHKTKKITRALAFRCDGLDGYAPGSVGIDCLLGFMTNGKVVEAVPMRDIDHITVYIQKPEIESGVQDGK